MRDVPVERAFRREVKPERRFVFAGAFERVGDLLASIDVEVER